MLRTVDTLDALTAVLTGSATRPVLLFKHSLTCGTSAWAHEQVEQLDADTLAAVDVHVVVVQTAREVSRVVETTLGVRHESPQVLLVVDGRVVWHASHYRVAASAIRAAVDQHTSAVER